MLPRGEILNDLNCYGNDFVGGERGVPRIIVRNVKLEFSVRCATRTTILDTRAQPLSRD